MNETQRGSSTVANQPERGTIVGVHGIRYQVTDVARAAEFYTDHFGFKLEHQQLPGVRQCVAGRCHAAAQWAGSIGISTDARR